MIDEILEDYIMQKDVQWWKSRDKALTAIYEIGLGGR